MNKASRILNYYLCPVAPISRTPQLQINDATPAVDWRLCGIADNYFNSSVCECVSVCVLLCCLRQYPPVVCWKPPADVLFLRLMSHYMNESMLNKCVRLLTRIICLFVSSFF